MADTKGLSGGELLTQVYEALKARLGVREVSFPRKALSEIANDSDYHRTRIGYMGYERAMIVAVDSNCWAIALGEACGDYPADPYCCDIAVIPVSPNGGSDEALAAEIAQQLRLGSYFDNSLILAFSNGTLGHNRRSRFAESVGERVMTKTEEFVSQRLETDPNLVHGDLRPVTKTPLRYKPEFVAFLCEAISAALGST